MAKYNCGRAGDYDLIQRLCRHHDHLKSLTDAYAYMRQKETYERMLDSDFRCDPDKMKKLDNSYFTSLIIRLSEDEGGVLFGGVKEAYLEVEKLIKRYYPGSTPEIYFDSAHITLKSISDGKKQNKTDLEKYASIIKRRRIVEKWINRSGNETILYGMGLFTNLNTSKGLSLGIRFYPTLPLVQIIRGEAGNALYDALDKGELNHGDLRPEERFHTMLTHSTGFRARDLEFPLDPEFIQRFVRTVEKYDRVVFGNISDIELADIFIRNGKSDKLAIRDKRHRRIGEEISLENIR